MDKIELLAPAGSMESLIAAVQCGADAVYLGGNAFSARAYASNFDDENMQKAIDYCHLYGVKVYVTMNTLVKDGEMKAAISYASKLHSFGTDALIIQDTGLAKLIHVSIPKLELHASTQMTIHNEEGACFYKEVGFKRIVLSRELSLKEVEAISKKVETEIFIHGALCICYSGQCLMSSIIGGRSGNRGRCAQPCRMEYSLINKKTVESKKAYLLSPKDICTLDNINEIIMSGTSSLKIEGRMKRPEYVAGVVSIYRKAIDAYYEGIEFKIEDSIKTLEKLFNREGFSKAYMFGNVGKDMMAFSFPRNTGVAIGSVIKNSIVKLGGPVSKGDGIRVGLGDEGFIISKLLKNGEEVEQAELDDEVSIKPGKYTVGDVLYQTADSKLLNELKKTYEKPFERKINVPLKVLFLQGENLCLSANFNGKPYQVFGEVVQKFLNKPITEEKLIENLSKSSDTPFKFFPIEIEKYEEGFMPVSLINNVRRELVELIEKDQIVRNELIEVELALNCEGEITQQVETMICVSNKEQLRAAEELGFENICVNVLSRELSLEGKYLKVPNIIKGEFKLICDIIEEALLKAKGLVTANAGVINKFKGRIPIIGDYKLNQFNSFSLGLYENFLSGTCLSLELNKSELASVIKRKPNSYQMFLYGKPELMISEYCVIGSVCGGKGENLSCNRSCEKGSFVLQDKMNQEFSVLTDKFCRMFIYNTVPINLIPNMKEIKKLGIKSFRLDFIEEDYETTKNVLENFKIGNWQGEYNNFTRGHYKRGVE